MRSCFARLHTGKSTGCCLARVVTLSTCRFTFACVRRVACSTSAALCQIVPLGLAPSSCRFLSVIPSHGMHWTVQATRLTGLKVRSHRRRQCGGRLQSWDGSTLGLPSGRRVVPRYRQKRQCPRVPRWAGACRSSSRCQSPSRAGEGSRERLAGAGAPPAKAGCTAGTAICRLHHRCGTDRGTAKPAQIV